jgi:opacity protein-like surface antigen
MKHILLTILACFAISMAAQAQLTVGIKGGIGASKVDVDEVRNNPWQYKDSENITGYHAGVFTRLQILGLFVQPEAVLSSTGGKVDIFNDQTSETSTEKFKFTRLDVPLLAGINLFGVARVQAGPVASVLLSAKQEGKTMDDYLKETDWGWQAGVGVDISRLTLDLRYERVKRAYTNDAQQSSYDLTNDQVLLSVGYKLFQ